MDFNNKSEVVKLETYAKGYHSGREVYGKLYVPAYVYDDNKEAFDDIELYAYEIDGKHSENPFTIKISRKQVVEFAEDNVDIGSSTDESDDFEYDFRLHEWLLYNTSFDEDKRNLLWTLKREIENLNATQDMEFTLSEDTEIDGLDVPKGATISYTCKTDLAEDIKFTIEGLGKDEEPIIEEE